MAVSQFDGCGGAVNAWRKSEVLTSHRGGASWSYMDIPDDAAFLRDLVKASRQKLHHVAWVDRDGTHRQTSLSQPEVVRLNQIASSQGISKSEALRRAAHIPVERPPKPT